MKILHTADWHLGHQLHGYSRYAEHQYFLDWLLERIEQHQVDALLISGDIFDTANPSATSWQQLYGFLGQLAKQSPGCQVVVAAGNHDSPSKLNAPQHLLTHFDLHFIGSVPYNDEGHPELNRLLLPLKKRDGELKGWVLAVPFLRSSDLRLDGEIADSQQRWQSAISEVYQGLGELAQSLLQPEHCLVSMGHGHVTGGQISELSERHVQIGGQHALPLTIFPERSDYVALGHLHLAQQIKVREGELGEVHYSGSPLALSMSERRYRHQLKLLSWREGEFEVESLETPKLCQMLVVPEKPAGLEQVLAELNALPTLDAPFEQRPFLEVRVKLDQPQTQLREKVLAAIDDKGLRLAKISISYPEKEAEQHFAKAGEQLSNLKPEQVFELCHQQRFEGKPSEALSRAFSEVMEQVYAEGER